MSEDKISIGQNVKTTKIDKMPIKEKVSKKEKLKNGEEERKMKEDEVIICAAQKNFGSGTGTQIPYIPLFPLNPLISSVIRGVSPISLQIIIHLNPYHKI